MSIKIDSEFKSLIPPLTPDEYTQLEKNIIKDGIRDALIVWPQNDGNNILIDGHNRFQISATHAGIRFETKPMNFKDRDEAVVWIINNQLGKRNLPVYDKVTLQDKKRDALTRIAKKNLGGDHRSEEFQKSKDKNSCPLISRQEKRENSTDYKIAKAAGTSEDTVRKVRTINEKATEQTKQLVREGKLSINQAYNSVHPKKPDPVKQAMKEHENFLEKKKESVIDLESAKVDKINERIIDSSVRENVLKLLNIVTDFDRKYRDEDLDKALRELDDVEKKTIQMMCMTGKHVLNKIINYTC